jgi:hypothetical protein
MSWIEEVGCQARRIEETGCQACGKEEVGCQAHENSLNVREILGIDFPRWKNCSYMALRLLVRLVVEALKRKWGRRIVEQRRGTLPGWDSHVGNERL